MYDSTIGSRIVVCKSHENTSMYVDTVTLFQKLESKVIDLLMTFEPTSVEVTCEARQKEDFSRLNLFPKRFFFITGSS